MVTAVDMDERMFIAENVADDNHRRSRHKMRPPTLSENSLPLQKDRPLEFGVV